MKITIAIVLLMLLIIGIVLIIAKTMKAPHTNEDEWPREVVSKVAQDRSSREAVQQEHPQLFAKVTGAMFRDDPIGINFETNTDEYDPEAGTVIPRLKDCSSAEDVTVVLHEEFSTWFGSDTAGPRDRYTKLGEEIWLLWNSTKTEQAVGLKGLQP